MVEWTDRSHFSVKGTTTSLEFAKRRLKDSDHAVGIFFSGRDWETSQDRGKEQSIDEKYSIDENLCQSSIGFK